MLQLHEMSTLASQNALLQDDRKIKFVKKFMNMARTVAMDNDSCFSRHIGCIITDRFYKILGCGYNGPPANTPHCDTFEYLSEFFLPQLTDKEKKDLDIVDPKCQFCSGSGELVDETGSNTRECAVCKGTGIFNLENELTEYQWCASKDKCGTCPRRLINAGPGERSSLCSCVHAECNAITNSKGDLRDAMIFCHCGVPCINCSGTIINSGIKEVHCLYVDGPDYHPVSRWLLKKGGVELFIYRESYLIKEKE